MLHFMQHSHDCIIWNLMFSYKVRNTCAQVSKASNKAWSSVENHQIAHQNGNPRILCHHPDLLHPSRSWMHHDTISSLQALARSSLVWLYKSTITESPTTISSLIPHLDMQLLREATVTWKVFTLDFLTWHEVRLIWRNLIHNIRQYVSFVVIAVPV